jgi:PAS domain S-box-containing protein
MRRNKLASGLGDFLQFISGTKNVTERFTEPEKRDDVESELHSHMQIFNASSMLAVYNLSGNIIYVNSKFCEISGYTEEELIGQQHSITHHPKVLDSIYSDIWKKLENGEVWQGEVKNMKKDGSAYWVMTTIAPVLDKNGKPSKYVSSRLDITKQKQLEEELRNEKVKVDVELFESMNYAKHVHSSFLTPEEEIKDIFPESFLIYNAQKVISGDFYRVEKNENKSIVVLGDSTGHGISASYMSIMALNILSRISTKHCCNPSGMLSTMHSEIITATRQNKKAPIIESADTMICTIDHDTMKLKYASAKIKGLILRNGEVIELKKDKCSIGEHSEKEFAINNHELDLKKGDCLYLFSDGITDQFGGRNDKKFGYNRLVELLKENHKRPALVQKKNIENILNEWQSQHEQTDDMTLLAMKIN